MKLSDSRPAREIRGCIWRSIGYGFVLALFLIGTFGSAAIRPVRAAEQTYVVERGDTLSGIAERFGVSATTIIEANDIQDPNLLYVGQILIIPLDDATSDPLVGTTRVTVQPGQSLADIAAAHDTTAREIADINGLPNGDLIVPGQVLMVPAGRSVPRTSSRGGGARLPLPPTPVPEPARPAGVTRQFKVTMYCLQGQMANGEFVHQGAASADRSVLPIGARLYVDGLGNYVVKDRFAVDAGQYRLDIWEPSCARAIQWGVRYVNVTVYN